MEYIYFTLVAVALYAFSDWLLNRIEIWRGARFPNRSLVFLVIIMTLSMTTFTLIQRYLDSQAQTPAATNQQPPTQQQ